MTGTLVIICDPPNSCTANLIYPDAPRITFQFAGTTYNEQLANARTLAKAMTNGNADDSLLIQVQQVFNFADSPYPDGLPSQQMCNLLFRTTDMVKYGDEFVVGTEMGDRLWSILDTVGTRLLDFLPEV